MHSKIWIFQVTCPDCGNVEILFKGENEDGRFYCDNQLTVVRGKKEWREECGYDSEKLRHMPEGSYEGLGSMTIMEAELAEAKAELDKAQAELAKAKAELDKAQAELWVAYNDSRREAKDG